MDINKMKLATTIDFELMDGTVVKCTLAMFQLKRLANENKALYATVTKFLAKGSEDIFEQIRVVYAAYLCANMGEAGLLTEDEFVIACGSDYAGVGEAVAKLIDPKKRTASADRSN